MKQAFVKSSRCPQPEELAAYLERKDARPDQSAIAAHIASCAYCSTELALMHNFLSSEPSTAEAEPVEWIARRLKTPLPRVQSSRTWRAPLLLAASLVLAAGLTIYFRASEASLSQRSTQDVYRSVDLRAISPVGDVAGSPGTLKWEGSTGTAVYHIRLLEVDRTEIWSADANEASIVLPPSIRAQLSPGRTFLWEAIARDSRGTRLGSTSLQKFHISSTQP